MQVVYLGGDSKKHGEEVEVRQGMEAAQERKCEWLEHGCGQLGCSPKGSMRDCEEYTSERSEYLSITAIPHWLRSVSRGF